MLPKILGVSFIIIDSDKLLVIRRNSIHENNSGAIAIPGGHVEENETPEQTVHRELWEELELQCPSLSLVHKAHRITEFEDQTVFYYVCVNWVGVPVLHEGQEFFWIHLHDYHKLDFDIDRQAIQKLLKTNPMIK